MMSLSRHVLPIVNRIKLQLAGCVRDVVVKMRTDKMYIPLHMLQKTRSITENDGFQFYDFSEYFIKFST